MNRNEKISKLANAIRRYRGISQPIQPGKPVEWIVSPKIADRAFVVRWLTELGLPVPETLAKIEAFNQIDDFNDWIKTL